MKFKLIPKIKAEATLMMVLVLLNLTGCPFKKANEVANEDKNEDKNEVANEDKNEAEKNEATDEEPATLSRSDMYELFKNLGNDSVESAEFEYTLGDDTRTYKCDSFGSAPLPSTVNSLEHWFHIIAKDILEECTINANAPLRQTNFLGVNRSGKDGQIKQSYSLRSGTIITYIHDESDDKVSEMISITDANSTQTYLGYSEINLALTLTDPDYNNKVTKQVIEKRSEMDALLAEFSGLSLVSAEFEYTMDGITVNFKCDEHDNTQLPTTIKSAEQWRTNIHKDVFAKCIDNANPPPGPYMIYYMDKIPNTMFRLKEIGRVRHTFTAIKPDKSKLKWTFIIRNYDSAMIFKYYFQSSPQLIHKFFYSIPKPKLPKPKLPKPELPTPELKE